MAEHLVGVVFRTGTRLALELAGIGQDGVGLLLRDAHDLLLAGDGHRLAARVLDPAVRLGRGVVQQALALAHDLTGLGELGRERVADLVYDLEGRRNVHLAHVAFAEHRLRVFKQNRELFEQPQDSCFVHDFPSTQACRVSSA